MREHLVIENRKENLKFVKRKKYLIWLEMCYVNKKAKVTDSLSVHFTNCTEPLVTNTLCWAGVIFLFVLRGNI